MQNALMLLHERLALARREAGYATAREAAEALGVKEPTYNGHENGSRGFKRDSADRYARKFRVSLEWLLTGKGNKERRLLPTAEAAQHVNLVGYVGEGSATYFVAEDAQFDEVPAPAGANDATVAVEIRGDSLGPFFDRWLVYYDDVRQPVKAELIGKLCVVGLADGRILIKKVVRAKSRNLYHLLSPSGEPLLDVIIEWAARVKNMVPQ